MAAGCAFPVMVASGQWRYAMPRHWGETWDENHPHSELTGSIIAAAIRVQKGLELGLLLNFRTWPLKDGGIKRVIKSYT